MKVCMNESFIHLLYNKQEYIDFPLLFLSKLLRMSIVLKVQWMNDWFRGKIFWAHWNHFHIFARETEEMLTKNTCHLVFTFAVHFYKHINKSCPPSDPYLNCLLLSTRNIFWNKKSMLGLSNLHLYPLG